MKLSKNFSLREMTRSGTAIRNGIKNAPNEGQLVALTALCQSILQPLRDHFGSISVSSGLRVPELNKLIGGSATSDHCKGFAADFEVKDPAVSNMFLAQYIKKNMKFKQLILEFYESKEGPNSGWVHISYDPAGDNPGTNIKRASRIKGKTVYKTGLQE